MAQTTPVDYTSRDYYALRIDLINAVKARVPDWRGDESSDFVLTLLEAYAFMGDTLNYYIDRVANEAFLPTAVQRQSLFNIADTYGYSPAGPRCATAIMLLTYVSETENANVTIPQGTLLRGVYDYFGEPIEVFFETESDVTITASEGPDPDTDLYTGTALVSAIEGRTEADTGLQISGSPIGVLLGTSDGTASQEFFLPNDQIAQGGLRVWEHANRTNGQEYFSVTTLMDASPSARIFKERRYADGTVSIRFGDGISGAIPSAGNEIRAVYRIGGGERGNVPTDTVTLLSEPIPGVSVTNFTDGSGGAAEETNASIRRNAAAALVTRQRVITSDDFRNLALTVAGVADASVLGSALTSVAVYVLPISSAEDYAPGFVDGGDIETESFGALKSQVKSALLPYAPYATTVSVLSPSYIGIALSITVYLYPEVRHSDAQSSLARDLKAAYQVSTHGFGEQLYPSDVYSIVTANTSVRASQISNFQRLDTATPGVAAVSDPIWVSSHELSYLDPTQLSITLVGGIDDLS